MLREFIDKYPEKYNFISTQIDRVANLITISTTSTDNAQRTQAEQELESLDLFSCVMSILSLIEQTGNDYDNYDLKLRCATVLKVKFKKYGQSVSDPYHFHYYASFYASEIIMTKVTNMKIIQLLGTAIDEYFSYFPYLNHEKIAGEVLKNYVVPLKEMGVLELNKYYAALFITQAVLNVFNEKCDTIYGHFRIILYVQAKEMVVQYTNLYNIYTDKDSSTTNSFNFANNNQGATDKNATYAMLSDLLICFEESSKLMFNFALVQSEMKSTHLKIFFADPDFISILQCMISLNNDLYVGYGNQLDSMLYTVKMNSINAVRVYMYRNQKSVPNESNALLPLLTTLTESMIEKLTNIFQSNTIFDDLEESHEYKNLILASTQYLCLVSKCKQLFSCFANLRKEIVVHLILNLIRLTERDREKISSDPQEYARDFFASIPNKKKNTDIKPKSNEDYENIRYCGSKFLQLICENIDGLITFVGVLGNELVDYSIQESMGKEIKLAEEYPNICSVQNATFLKLSGEVKLDLGLQVLSIVKDQMEHRIDIKDQVLENMIKYLMQILSSGSPLVITRGLLVFRQYSVLILAGDSQQQLTQASQQLFVNCLKQLMSILVTKDGQGREAMVLVASDCFEKVMLNHFKDAVLSPYISEMMEILLYQVQQTKNLQLIELILNLVKKQPEKVKEIDVNGICWYVRIFDLFSQLQNSVCESQEEKEIYYKTTSALELLAEKKSYQEIAPHLEQCIDRMIGIHNLQAEPIHFHIDLLRIAYFWMDNVKRVTDSIWNNLVPLSRTVLENKKGTISDVLPFFNILLEIDSSRFYNDVSVINYLLDKCMMVSFSKQSQYQDIIESQIMCQLIIQYFSQYGILDAHVKTLVESICQHFMNDTEVISSTKLRFMTTIFTCIGYKRDYVFPILRTSQAWTYIVEYCTKNHMVRYDYERKLVISGYIGIIYYLLKEEYSILNPANYDQFIKYICEIIKRISFLTTKNAKTKSYEQDYKEIASAESNSNQENEYEWYMYENSDDDNYVAHIESETGAILRSIYSPLLKFDEFELARQLMSNMPMHPLWAQIEDSLDNKTKTNLKMASKFTRVDVGTDSTQIDNRARIKLKAKGVGKFNVNYNVDGNYNNFNINNNNYVNQNEMN